jgi:hypothetical protein
MIIKKKIGLLLSSFLILINTPAYADVYVPGYTKTDGTRVKAHYRSDPDGNFNNNWSTKGNTNPYTGKEGTKTHPNYSIGNGYNVEVPAPTNDIDFEQLAEQQQKANEELLQQIKEQSERLEKQREEIDKRFESQREESVKQLEESLKALDEVGKNYTPPTFNTSTYTNSQNVKSDDYQIEIEQTHNYTEISDDSIKSEKKIAHSKPSVWDKLIIVITGLFKS